MEGSAAAGAACLRRTRSMTPSTTKQRCEPQRVALSTGEVLYAEGREACIGGDLMEKEWGSSRKRRGSF